MTQTTSRDIIELANEERRHIVDLFAVRPVLHCAKRSVVSPVTPLAIGVQIIRNVVRVLVATLAKTA